MCGLTFQISPFGTEDPEYDTDGERAVACDLDTEQGRCLSDTDEYRWLQHWGYVPKHETPLQLVDGPESYIEAMNRDWFESTHDQEGT